MSHLQQFSGKSVVVTGHTGFKGSWLVAWLRDLGAKVTGIALEPPTSPSHHVVLGNDQAICDLRLDVREQKRIRDAVLDARPAFVFHLAAQPLVRASYKEPVLTWETNVMGTLHVMEALREVDWPCAAVIVTSDKCYDNVEWVWGYRETDALGGPDPYSASKGAAELVVRSHVKSFFPVGGNVRVASARAGNVIGGGDWAADRIVPDCVTAWSRGETVCLRNPHSTRPWQHVLEPLSGYLCLAAALELDEKLHGQAFNFGPNAQQNHSVLNLVEEMSKYWDQVKWEDVSENSGGPYESGLLKLNCDKALHYLGWWAVMGFSDTVRMTAEWYGAYYGTSESAAKQTHLQIKEYMQMAKQQEVQWAQ